MALQKTWIKSGVTYTDAYHRVLNVTYCKDHIKIPMGVWQNKTDSDNGEDFIGISGNVLIDVSDNNWLTFFDTDALDTLDQNPLERAYEYFKAHVSTPFDFTTGTTDV